jgi:fumarylacetoacetate (FAA) hydrolase
MKLVSYLKDEHEHLGVLINEMVYDMEVLHPDLPNTMNLFLTYWEDSFPIAQAGELMLKEGTRTSNKGIALKELELLVGMGMLFASMWRQPGATEKWI